MGQDKETPTGVASSRRRPHYRYQRGLKAHTMGRSLGPSCGIDFRLTASGTCPANASDMYLVPMQDLLHYNCRQ